MPLSEAVASIYANADTRETFQNSLARFRVDDVGADRRDLEVVLLVESPHTHEIGYQFPLAGDTGRRVRCVLDKCHVERISRGPIGRLVHDQAPHPSVPRLGIMNVSQLPFESDAYDCLPWRANDCRGHDNWDDYIADMSTIKDGPGVRACKRKRETCQRLDRAITSDLRRRLSGLYAYKPNILLVCCGEVAQEFFKKSRCSLNWPCGNLPHPSPRRGGWKELSSQEGQCLRDIVNRIWPLQACTPPAR